jgi:DNA-binding SARP family transcriptional activator
MPLATLRLLGDFALHTGDGFVRLGRKGQALVAYAAMHPGSGVPRARLAGLLWPDEPEDDARCALRQCLHLARGALGPAMAGLHADAERIALCEEAFDIDVRRFEQLAAGGTPGQWLEAAALYQGDFLHDHDGPGEFAAWSAAQRMRLRELAQAVLARLAAGAADTVHIDAAVQFAHRLLAADPVHEGCHQSLMRLHARAGRRAKALEAWDQCRRTLRRELDVEPSAQTRGLAHELRGESHAAVAVVSSIATRPVLGGGRKRSPEALDLVLRGWQLFSLYTAHDNARARAAYESAIAHWEEDAEALALLGWTHWFDAICGWTAHPAASYREAHGCAARALACNRGHPSPHALMGKVLLWKGRHEAALQQLRLAVACAPQAAYPRFNLGDALMWCGQPRDALQEAERALALDENDHGLFHTIRGHALWMMREPAGARSAFDSAINRNPGYPWAHGGLAAVHAESGALDAARAAARTARRLNRRISLSFARRVLPFRLAEHRERMAEAWAAAGLPEREAPFPRSERSS